jgi:hypothetical protein
MTKSELRDKIKKIVKQIYNPQVLNIDAGNEISLDALKFPVLGKFPELKKVIEDLLTNQYEIFLTDIQWVSPRPTTFRIILGNDESFYLIYTQRSWIAKVEGKKFYLLNLSEEEQAAESISRLLSYGTKEEKSETTGTETDNTETETPDEFSAEPPEVNPEEFTEPEETTPEPEEDTTA